MTYVEWRDAKQKEYNALPIFYAFSNEQFREAMEERGLTENDTDKIYKLGSTGGFYLKSDAPIIREYINKDDGLKDLMEGESGFAESAFYYEMQNHEYHINWQADWDVCSCFGDCEYGEDKSYAVYLVEMGYSDNVVKEYRKARSRFLNDADKNGWY